MVLVRVANDHERKILLDGDEGFVADDGEAVIGYCGWNLNTPGAFYGHSLYVTQDPSKIIAARLIQRVFKKAKTLGFEKIQFGIDPNDSGMIRLIQHGKAQITHLWVEMRA